MVKQREEHYLDCDLIIFCYSQKRSNTLNRLKEYYDEVNDYLKKNSKTQSSVVKFLMACQDDDQEVKMSVEEKKAGYGRGDKSGASNVTANDLAVLKAKGVQFSDELTTSTFKAKDDYNVQRTMNAAIEKLFEIQDKRRKYQSKSNSSRVI